jgi:hypothetical protein
MMLRNARLQTMCWGLILLAVAGSLQAYIPYPWDADTAYHAVVGKLIREYGILHSFPWTPFSWLADNYADKELLFHLLFVPLTGFNWVTAAKVVGTITGATALFSIYLVLRQEKVAYPWVWSMLPLLVSWAFLYRFVLVRPHLLSIALAIAVVWASSRERFLLLGILCALYPWTYVAWHMSLILVLISETARYLSVKRFQWRTFAAAFVGIVSGILLHPNSINLVKFNWITIVDILFRNAWGKKEGFELGKEFNPFTFGEWAQWLALAVVMVTIAAFISWRHMKEDLTPLAYSMTAVAFGILTAKTARFDEYFVPFAVVSLALSARYIRWRFFPFMVALIAAIYTISFSWDYIPGLNRRTDDVPPEIVTYLRQVIPPGAQIFTTEWGLTGALMLALPERRFIVALDPTLFYVKDPDLYRLWYRLPREAPPNSAELIRSRFNARYALCLDQPDRSRFFRQLSASPGVRTLLVSQYWMLFDLGNSDTTGGRSLHAP